MRYHELIELYKKNELDEIQKKRVEADLEKHEAISEYLLDREDGSDFGSLEADVGVQMDVPEPMLSEQRELEFTKKVNRKIKFTFMKLGLCVTMITLVLVLFVIFLLPKVVDGFYYNPGKAVGTYGNQAGLDYYVYTELCMPGYNRDCVSVQSRGYGVYDIMILQNMTYNHSITNLAGRIERDKLTLYDPNVLQRPAVNVFAWYDMDGGSTASLTDLIEKERKVNHCSAGSAQYAAEALEKLDEQENYIAYVSLDKMMPYQEFIKFLSELEEEEQIESVWCAVFLGDQEKNSVNNLGFQCRFSSSHSLEWDREKYPRLVLWNQDDNEYDVDFDEDVQNEDDMKTHFTSMLKYIADQEKFLKLQEPWGVYSAQEYRNAADYVEGNGLMIYGFAGIGHKSALLKLNQEKEVYEIYTQKLR